LAQVEEVGLLGRLEYRVGECTWWLGVLGSEGGTTGDESEELSVEGGDGNISELTGT